MCVLVLSLQSCLTLCDPMDCSPPGSSVHGILQARILERGAMLSSRGSSRRRDQTCISYISCTGRQALCHQCNLGSPLKPQSCLQKQAPAQDTLGRRSRQRPRHTSSAHGCKATHVGAWYLLCGGPGLMGRPGEHCRRGVFWGENMHPDQAGPRSRIPGLEP